MLTTILGGGGGVTGFATGVNMSEADAFLVISAWLMAVNVTVCCAVTLAGAVYSPLLMLPRPGVKDHITPVFVVPETEAVNCAECPATRLVELGETEIPTGTTGGVSMTVAVATLVESASLVAEIVTWVALVIEDGAV